jgi:predicted DNA-binding transcriptional regulator YafY
MLHPSSLIPHPSQHILPVLRRALATRRPVTISYDTGGEGIYQTRTVHPVQLERRGDTWLLHAFCTARQADRVFRLDRIGDCLIA